MGSLWGRYGRDERGHLDRGGGAGGGMAVPSPLRQTLVAFWRWLLAFSAWLFQVLLPLAVLALYAWLLPTPAFAAFPATRTNPDACTTAPCYTYSAGSIGGTPASGGGWPTPLSACQKSASNYNADPAPGFTAAATSATTTTCYYTLSHPTYGTSAGSVGIGQASAPPVTPTYSCPANSTLSGSQCTCASGYVEDGSSCVVQPSEAEQYCTSLNGQGAVATTPRPLGSSGLDSFATCYSNQYSLSACSGTMNPDFCAQSPEGKWHCVGKVAFSASAPCVGTPDPQTPEAVPSPLPNPPPAGMCPGEVNGVAVNVPCKSTQSKTTTTKETTEGGNTTSTTKQSSTTCSGAGSCTKTVTTSTTSGGVTTTKVETTTQPKGEFCAENPGARECGQESTFGGTCEAAFTCTGDAVQCATARAANEQLCELREAFQVSPEMDALADRVLNGTELGDPKASAQVINVGVFDQSNPLSSSCPADVPFPLMGQSMVIPLSEYCHWLQLLGNMLVAVSLLGATIFVLRGV